MAGRGRQRTHFTQAPRGKGCGGVLLFFIATHLLRGERVLRARVEDATLLSHQTSQSLARAFADLLLLSFSFASLHPVRPFLVRLTLNRTLRFQPRSWATSVKDHVLGWLDGWLFVSFSALRFYQMSLLLTFITWGS